MTRRVRRRNEEQQAFGPARASASMFERKAASVQIGVSRRTTPIVSLALGDILHLYFPYEAIFPQGTPCTPCIDQKGYIR